jgi:hypothetical protein
MSVLIAIICINADLMIRSFAEDEPRKWEINSETTD